MEKSPHAFRWGEPLRRFGSRFQTKNIFAHRASLHCQGYPQPSQERLNAYKSSDWFVLLSAVMALWLIGSAFGLVPVVASAPDVIISEVRVTSVRDTTFNVSWVTDQLATGEVHYGTDPANLDQIAYDDRGAETSDDTHYVTLVGLPSNTAYYFDVVSDGTTDDNGGAHYTVTTGPTLGLPASDTIYGQVSKADGTTPAEGTIVYITLFDDDGSGSSGQAAELSSLVDSSGYWYANLGNARTADLSGYFDYSAGGDGVALAAQGAGDGTAGQTVDTADDSPATPMVLAGDEPIAGLAATNDGPTALGSVTTLTATITAGSNVTFTWAFGDGHSSYGAVVTHTYPAAGGYTAVVTASNNISVVTATTMITVYNPVQADFTASPTSGVPPLTVAFTNTSNGDYTDSFWSFGDRVTSTHTSPIHTYTTAEVYTVTLTVSGTRGTDTLTRTNYVTVVEGAQATIDPIGGSTLVYTDTQGNPTIIQVPAGAVTETTTLVYTPVETATAPSGFVFAGHAFNLEAYRNDVLLSGFTFSVPVTVTIHYTDTDVARMDEESLVLEYWNVSENAWEDVACGPYDRHPDENWLSVPICHLSLFALFGVESGGEHWLYLPLILKNHPPPEPTPTPTPTATSTPTPTATPTATPTSTPTTPPQPPPDCYPTVEATLTIGVEPLGAAVRGSPQNWVYVANHGSNSVSVIDGATNSLVTTVSPVPGASGVAYDGTHDLVYVTNETTDQLTILRASDNTITQTVSVGHQPHGVAYNPTSNRIYVANYGDDSVTVLNGDTRDLVTIITDTLGQEPAHLAVNPNTNKIYVTYHGSDRVGVIHGNANALTFAEYHAGNGPWGIFVDTVRNLVYVATIDTQNICVIDGNDDSFLGWAKMWKDKGTSSEQPVPMRMIVVNPDMGSTGHVYVTTASDDGGFDKVILLGKGWPEYFDNPIARDVGPNPIDGLALNTATDRVYVTSRDANRLTVLWDGTPICPYNFALGYTIEVCRVGIDGDCH
jgi:YVTN family beta-propeller protein